MESVKIEIIKTGKLFHYAHFICDVLFPEINMHLYNYKTIFRKRNITQTIGIFKNIYEEIMESEYKELYPRRFELTECELLIVDRRKFIEPENFLFFRNYVLGKYNIKDDETYPEIILIQRGKPIELVDDPILKKYNWNGVNGNEKREIENIEELKNFMEKIFNNKYKTIILENIPFVEQIKYFFNAKLIIGIHGGAFANMFFCKKDTNILEIFGDRKWNFFNIISKNLELNHKKCPNFLPIIKRRIINYLQQNTL